MTGRPAILELQSTTLSDAELVARMFRPLGDATRLRIVELLIEEGEFHQMEIVRRLGASQARVSEHLACLTWCGFVGSRSAEEHLPGSINIPLKSMNADSVSGLDKLRPVVVYCWDEI